MRSRSIVVLVLASLVATCIPTAEAVPLPLSTRSFTFAATGDIVPDNSVLSAAWLAGKKSGIKYDMTALFAPISNLVHSADLAICHMETPVARQGQRPGKYGRERSRGWRMLTPFETIAAVVATGFDRCSTASNHSWDLGRRGIESTLAGLEAAGVSHVGTARNATEAAPDLLTVNGVRVAHLAYTVTSNTSLPRDAWTVAWGHMDRVVSDVETSRRNGAEVVILSLHGGKEGPSFASRTQRQWADEATRRTDVDLVVMHGPHTVQPVELVNGTWVFWSVGNLVSGMGPGAPGIYGSPNMLDGLLAWARFDEDPQSPGHFSTSITPVALCLYPRTRVVYPATSALTDPTLPTRVRQGLEACVKRTRKVVPSAA